MSGLFTMLNFGQDWRTLDRHAHEVATKGVVVRFFVPASVCALFVGLTAQTVSAQSLRNFDTHGRNDTRILAAVSLPLGGSRKSTPTAPRIDLAIQSIRLGQPQSITPLRFDPKGMDDAPRRETRVSITLDQRSEMMVNGVSVARFGPRLEADEKSESNDGGGLSTGAGIAIGVGLLAGATLFTTLEIKDEFDDIFEPD